MKRRRAEERRREGERGVRIFSNNSSNSARARFSLFRKPAPPPRGNSLSFAARFVHTPTPPSSFRRSSLHRISIARPDSKTRFHENYSTKERATSSNTRTVRNSAIHWYALLDFVYMRSSYSIYVTHMDGGIGVYRLCRNVYKQCFVLNEFNT